MVKSELPDKVLEGILTLTDACYEMYKYAEMKDFKTFSTLSFNTLEMLEKINDIFSKNIELEKAKIGLVENSIDSLKRIITYSKTRTEKLFDKIQYELIPLLEELYIEYYYISLIKGDREKEKIFHETVWKEARVNKYIDESYLTNNYKYDVSICILAYNKLEYTKKCVESVLKFTPSDINYELILINHGSNDGTKEYFESIGCTKQFDLLNNGIGVAAYVRALEGKYRCLICNDIIVGPNYLSNMITCLESDPKNIWVVPSTPNISNLQTIPVQYTNIDEMNTFMQQNNVSDPYRWEQRFRLCDPIRLERCADIFSSYGIQIFYRNFWDFGFGDDLASLVIRRSGGKCILAKDTYCHHFGSVTLKQDKDYNTAQNFRKGREKFHEFFGIDPWGKGCCYTPELFSKLDCNNIGQTNILGINCGLGSDPLKIRESIKENAQNLNSFVYNVTDEKEYLLDVEGVSDDVMYVNTQQELFNAFSDKLFDYIIFEGDLWKYSDTQKIISDLLGRLTQNGNLVVFDSGDKCRDLLSSLYPSEEFKIPGSIIGEGSWYMWKKD